MSSKDKIKINDWGQEVTNVSDSNDNGKFNISDQPTFSTHRSGWNYAIDSIRPLHNNESDVKFFGFLENEFGWRLEENKEDGFCSA